MNETQRSQLRSLIVDAANLLPDEGGRVHHDCSSDEMHLVGDELGLLRLGLGLAKGALSPLVESYGYKDALDIGDYTWLGSDIGLVVFRKVSESEAANPTPARNSKLRDRVILFIVSLLLVTVGFVGLSGLYQIYSWIRDT